MTKYQFLIIGFTPFYDQTLQVFKRLRLRKIYFRQQHLQKTDITTMSEEYRSFYEEEQEEKRLKKTNAPSFDPNEKTCFVCDCNLNWMNFRNPGYANCGCYSTMGVSKRTPPQMALTCRGFKRKN